MAALNKLCLMMIFVACTASMMKTGFSQPSESPEIEPAYAEGPDDDYLQYLSDCADKLSNECGDQIYFGTFYGNATVDHDCCLKLVNVMGKRCHENLINFIIESPKFEQNATEIAFNSEQIWNRCALSALPAAPEPAQQV